MGRQGHLSSEELLDYTEGRMDSKAAARVRAHLETDCPSCTEELVALTRLVSSLETDRSEGVPETVRQRAFAIMPIAPPPPAILERILAVLTYDSRTVAVPSFARDLAPIARTRELLYEVSGLHVALLCRQEQGLWNVAGQALSEDADAAELETDWQVLVRDDDGEQRVDANQWNEFRLPPLRPNIYTLLLRSSRQEIVLPELDLRD